MHQPRAAFLSRILNGRRFIGGAFGAVAGILLLMMGVGESLDRFLRAERDALRTHDASGEIHIIEIDARSLAEIDKWPWPRRLHAMAVDRLTAAAARTIAFDVDFSATSDPLEDALFAAALKRAGGSVILPTLRQNMGAGSSGVLDTVPIEPFRKNAFLGAVTVVPDPDGQIRSMPLGIETKGVPRPSLAALVAETPVEIGKFYPIDYSIDEKSIPRHSFADLVAGRISPAALAGKRVLIGATAVELGDRYAVPGSGVVPGVVIQALAAETLLGGVVPAVGSGLLPLLVALLVVAVASCRPRRLTRVLLLTGGTMAILTLPLITESFLALTVPVAPAVGAIGVAAMAMVGLHFAHRLHESTMTDSGTGLPNLSALEAEAAGTEASVVVVARIDRFADIAASVGPADTIDLLKRVADRIGLVDARTVYRIDEGSLAWVEREEQGETLVQRLDALGTLMRSPIDCGRPVDVKLRFGIAGGCRLGAKHQVANAALAAVQAGRAGSPWKRHGAAELDAAEWRLSLISALDAAMAAGQVWNAYQPKLDLTSGRIVGVEALVRWDHPERGRISPCDFIPLVEEHGQISNLTAHVLERALADARRWARAGRTTGVAINVSATLLGDAEFVSLVRRKIEAAGLEPGLITLEVTETAAMMDPAEAIAALRSWRALGVQISIDDYGTGHSSLGYLQRLPATELKIDMSFVTTLAANPRNVIVVRSTIAMAHELGMKVVAEGVEDAECLELLRSLGCDTAQGWHIGRPVPAATISKTLAQEHRRAA